MKVTKEQIIALSNLVRLNMCQDQSEAQAEITLERMQDQMGSIVAFMDSISKVDTEGVEPLYSPMLRMDEAREDSVIVKLTPDSILANAPERQQQFFVVPPVI